MSFSFPDDAVPWGNGYTSIEVNGVRLDQFIHLDPQFLIGRVFWTDENRRIFLRGPHNNNPVPLTIQVDGEPVERFGLYTLYETALRAVEHMHKIDGIHAGLESEPEDGE